MANDEREDGIDNGDGVDQCIVWPCDEVRVMRWGTVKGWKEKVPTLHCHAHQGFAHVDQEENDGS